MLNYSTHNFKKVLKRKGVEVKKRLEKKHGKTLKKFRDKGIKPDNLRGHAIKLLAGTTMASALLAQPAVLPILPENLQIKKLDAKVTSDLDKKIYVNLLNILPKNREQINPWELGRINLWLKVRFGIESVSHLYGHSLDRQYGYMGMEQHLKRYPSDSLAQHDEMQQAGLAPGLGAWGYFAYSKSELSEQDYLREKYYVAVQTLYLPEWQERHTELKDWYKFRKMIVVNPENNSAVVAVIADAGPARWTGKVFGGSPEVMRALDLDDDDMKGKVLLLFLDDEDDNIPLGPLKSKIPVRN